MNETGLVSSRIQAVTVTLPHVLLLRSISLEKDTLQPWVYSTYRKKKKVSIRFWLSQQILMAAAQILGVDRS